jgi:DNA-binding beta-propeller fold protein YncE
MARKDSLSILCLAVMLLGMLSPRAQAADPVRSFDGSNDQLRVRVTPASNIIGAVTVAALIRPDSVTEEDELVGLHTAGGSASGYGFLIGTGNVLGLSNGVEAGYSQSSPLVDNEWQLVVVTKASGAAVPRFHVYRFGTQSWTHKDGTKAVANASSVSAGTVRFATRQNSAYYDGDLAAAALYAYRLSDAEVERLAYDYYEWLGLEPGSAWIFNQADLTHPVLDETERGANELVDDTVDTEVITGQSPLSADPDDAIFLGNFSSGDLSPWWEEQEEGPGAMATIASGSLPPGERFYGHFALSGGDIRAEVASGCRLYEGSDVYVRFLARLGNEFPAEESESVWGSLIWQLHQHGSVESPPIALHVNGAEPGYFALREGSGKLWWHGPEIDEGVWHEFIIRVNHSQNSTVGFAELWFDGQQQTMTNGELRYYGKTLLDEYNYPKAGYYRDDDTTDSGEVDIAGYRISRSFPPFKLRYSPTFNSSFGSAGSGDGQFSFPSGIAADGQGNVWVVDTANNRVQKFDSTGKYLAKFGSNGSGDGQFKNPGGIAVDSQGNIWIADSGNNRLQKFDPTGKYLSKFGSSGSGNGQFNFPAGIAIDAQGNIWVVDAANNRIQKFNSKGEYQSQFGSSGAGNGQFSFPTSVAIDAAGSLWVTDWGNNRLQKFDSGGKQLDEFGSFGSGLGQFKSPASVAIDAQDSIWVIDAENNRAQKFSADGEFLTKFGAKGSGTGQLSSPRGIAIDPQGSLWITDFNNNRVQKWTNG